MFEAVRAPRWGRVLLASNGMCGGIGQMKEGVKVSTISFRRGNGSHSTSTEPAGSPPGVTWPVRADSPIRSGASVARWSEGKQVGGDSEGHDTDAGLAVKG
jgi:hypothetical protein